MDIRGNHDKNEEVYDNSDSFQSDLIDLSGLDLTAIRSLPNPVLRAALERVCAELGDETEATAFFQNVTAAPRADRRRYRQSTE